MSRKAEIDTSPPFRSVKEAVSLFGEKVLAGEVYATKLKQMHNESSENVHDESLKHEAVEAELEETKQNLQRAKEETMSMVHCLSSLQEELERTKQELEKLKQKEEIEKKKKHHEEPHEIDEDVKFVENNSTNNKFEMKSYFQREELEDQKMNNEFQKKRYVTFANGPYVAQVIMPTSPLGVEKLERNSSLVNDKKKMKKKKPLIPLIGDIFSRKKGQN